MKDDLMPCPFCGEQPEVVEKVRGSITIRCTSKKCTVKPCTNASSQRKTAREYWNKRARLEG